LSFGFFRVFFICFLLSLLVSLYTPCMIRGGLRFFIAISLLTYKEKNNRKNFKLKILKKKKSRKKAKRATIPMALFGKGVGVESSSKK
jgi:hypothetical protein